jgi:hypothetical protein
VKKGGLELELERGGFVVDGRWRRLRTGRGCRNDKMDIHVSFEISKESYHAFKVLVPVLPLTHLTMGLVQVGPRSQVPASPDLSGSTCLHT